MDPMKKILLVFGTRPEAIKMAPLVTLLKNSAFFKTKICVTAQHRQMLDQVLSFFEIVPDYDLDLMKTGQTINEIWAGVLTGIKPILEEWHPDWVFVHGDTATSAAAALASYFAGCKVAHIEAGLRTYNKWSPFPEEMNRQITGRIADLHFAPTEQAKSNLLKEFVDLNNIVVTGNTVIDALFYSIKKLKSGNYTNDEIEVLKKIIEPSEKCILVTGHRRENFGEGFINICYALKEISNAQNLKVVYPVHLNPNVQKPVNKILKGCKNIYLLPPLSYPSFVWAMNNAKIIITDSGGIQEEAPSLGKPVLVMRDTTERPEAVEAGTAILVGTDKNKIVSKALDLLENEELYMHISNIKNPYGDGNASSRILRALISMENEGGNIE
jgi:UDP-N-acetylglucosamine 2-epimerase (non-hydrolysing)